MVKRITLKKAKAKAWKAFSLYIRLKGSKNGANVCFTCDKVLPIGELQAGHGIAGRSNAVLFLESVVKPQCAACNIFKRGNYSVFTRKLIGLYGLRMYDELVIFSHEVKKYTVQEFLDLEEKYKRPQIAS